MNAELWRSRGASFGPMLVGGFAATVAAGCAWFISHLPWLGLTERAAIPLILGCWFILLAAFAARVRRSRSLGVGLGAGFISALAGLVFFGSQLSAPATVPGASTSVVPNAGVLAAGFVALGAALGLVAGLVGRVVARQTTLDQPAAHWLSRFAVVACVAVAPLILIGGLVTSTNSGMAVPDWPRTYGSNMFLYPLTGHVGMVEGKPYPHVYVEHAHRLFGAFVGLTMLVLLAFTLLVERRRWVKWLAFAAFLLVCVQGVLGGLRVRENSVAGALAHGVLAQLTFATIVGLAVALSDRYRALTPNQHLLEPRVARRVKFLCTFTLHALILQLILGATYRHFRIPHALWTHIGWSVVVMIVAVLAGFTLRGEKARRNIVGASVANIGLALALVAALQFGLGWLTFIVTGLTPNPQSVLHAVVRTCHQANGGVLLGIATAAFVWGRRLGRANPIPATPSPGTC